MNYATVVALLLATVGEASALSSPEMPPRSIVKPDAGWGALALVIVDLDSSRNLAPGYYCDPPEPGEEDNSICLGASMFYQRGRIRRLIAATPDFDNWRPSRFKTITGHAVRAAGGGRYLALLERTKTHAWVPWRILLNKDRACLPLALAEKFKLVLHESTRDASGTYCSKTWMAAQ
jgi:hypothetical protein